MRYAVLLVLALVAPVSMAADRGGLITGPAVVDMLDELGFSAELTRDEADDPLVVTQTLGLRTFIYFYDCRSEGCEALQFRVGLDLADGTSMDVINDFNRRYRYVRGFLDEDDDPFLVMDVEMAHAEHAPQFSTHLGVWEELLSRFTEAVGF